jgi:hypothetical protein
VIAFREGTLQAIADLLRASLADATGVEVGQGSALEIQRLLDSTYEHHGGFRLRTTAVRA